MFDKKIDLHFRGGESHHHTHSTTVVEKRAPTDESVRLLAEMEEKALKRALFSCKLDTLHAKGVFHILRTMSPFEYELRGVAVFNGVERVFSKKVTSFDVSGDRLRRGDCMRDFIRFIAEEAANSYMEMALEDPETRECLKMHGIWL